jgi:pyruvate ferredoxin oxidoreductase gamma subunit
MLEILIQGRGGQGAQTAGNILARAFFDEGRYVQSFATYGGARRGTPVSSVIRVDDKPIRLRCDIEQADAILCFDASLLDRNLVMRAKQNAVILVNTSRGKAAFGDLPGYRVYTIDGIRVSEDNGMGRLINASLLGALSSVLNAPSIDSITRTITETAPVKKEQNRNACMAGYRSMQGD